VDVLRVFDPSGADHFGHGTGNLSIRTHAHDANELLALGFALLQGSAELHRSTQGFVERFVEIKLFILG